MNAIEAKTRLYKVVRIYHRTGKKETVKRNLRIEEAANLLPSLLNCLNTSYKVYKQ